MERLTGLTGSDEASAEYWMGKKPRLLVIKHGKEGSRAYAEGESWMVRPFPVKAMKGFGGGDGYASALLSGLMTGHTLEESLEMGSASAAMLVASHACSRDMPTEQELLSFIREKKAECGTIVTRL